MGKQVSTGPLQHRKCFCVHREVTVYVELSIYSVCQKLSHRVARCLQLEVTWVSPGLHVKFTLDLYLTLECILCIT